jgi:ABC-type sugar transport system ATPase subunit
MTEIALTDYFLAPDGTAPALAGFDVAFSSGDVCEIRTDLADHGHQFLKAVAMITPPVSGEYRFDGVLLSRRKYPEWLQYRRRICYIGPVSALVSNLTIRENLLLSRIYYENNLRLSLPKAVLQLCQAAGLSGNLSSRPGDLNPLGRRLAIAIRELSRDVALIIMDHTEDLIGHSTFRLLLERIRGLQQHGVPVVVMSEGENPIRRMTNRWVVITDGRLTTPASDGTNDGRR